MIDFNLHEGDPLIDDDVQLILQQIDILFGTTPRDLFGDLDYGTRYDTYLYKLHVTEDQLQREILHDLSSLDLRGFTPAVDVYLCAGTERDIAVIEINLYQNTRMYKKVYKIT